MMKNVAGGKKRKVINTRSRKKKRGGCWEKVDGQPKEVLCGGVGVTWVLF